MQILLLNNEKQKKIIDKIFHTLPVGILITDFGGNILNINREFCNLFGLDYQSEFVNKNILDLILDESFSREIVETTRLVEKKGKIVTNFSVTCKNGKLKYIQYICSLEKDEQLTFLLHIFLDVTEQKEIEFPIRKSEEKYKTYIELLSDAVWCFESKHPIPIDLPIEEQIQKIYETAYLSECNYTFAKFYGFKSIEEARGTPLSSIISLTNLSKVELLKNFILNNYNLSGFVTSFLATNGTEIFARNSLFGIIESGKLVRAWGVFQDITDLIKLQKQHQDTASQYENLVENFNSIIIHMDMEGIILFINSYGAKFFGYEKEELLGKPVVGTIVPTTESRTGRNLTNLIKEILQDPKRFEYNENENIKKDGTRVWIYWKNTPVYDSTGKCVEVLSVGIDLTEQKRKDLELLKTWDFVYKMVEALPDAVSFKDGSGRWVYANRSMLEIFN
ncbi:MAG: PAS domain S-box protein, partial [Candidatus Kapaibacteriota bacterium]